METFNRMRLMEINYSRCNVSNRLKNEIINAKGESFWQQLSQDILVPTDQMPVKQCSMCMRVFMQKFQTMLPEEEIKSILVNVRHDVRPDDFSWAVRLFKQIGNIDRFCIELQKIGLSEITFAYENRKGYYGQTIDREVMEYVHGIENIFYGRRYGNEILAEAIPYNVRGLLDAADDKQKRYALCHCQFARESILQDEGQVSPLMCECSLGHTMVLWEVVLDRKLEGEVIESALKGSNRCLFRIKLPDDIVERWTL